MTRDEILAMEPGRQLDAEIALRVLGVKEVTVVGKHYFIDPLDKILPSYSTDISAAWKVLEKLDKTHNFEIGNTMGGWNCFVFDVENVTATTAPEAICKAALLAVLK